MLASKAQDIAQWLHDQILGPVKACLDNRLGRSSVSDCQLRITPSSGIFSNDTNHDTLEVPLADHDETQLKNWLRYCFGNNRRRIRVEVDHTLLMQREIRLPIAAKSRLREVLSYEMDRLSPFNSEEVYFHFAPFQQKPGETWLRGNLIVAQKRRLDPWYELLSRENIDIASVTLAGDSKPLSLLPRTNHQSASMGGKLTVLLWSLISLLLVAVLISPIWQQRQIAIELEQAMYSAQAKASKIVELQERLNQRRDAIGMVSNVRKLYLPVSEVLLELTRLIPEGSWTQKVSVQRNVVDISGESDQASELISLLERSPMFEEVRFKSPLVKSRVSDKEHFDLTMKISQEPVQ